MEGGRTSFPKLTEGRARIRGLFQVQARGCVLSLEEPLCVPGACFQLTETFFVCVKIAALLSLRSSHCL